MKISENDLLLHFDEAEQKLVIYRFMEQAKIDEKVLHTEYPISRMQRLDPIELSRLLGEDILVSLRGTRKLLVES